MLGSGKVRGFQWLILACSKDPFSRQTSSAYLFVSRIMMLLNSSSTKKLKMSIGWFPGKNLILDNWTGTNLQQISHFTFQP